MTELKTLKDLGIIELKSTMVYHPTKFHTVIDIEILRQEAIKWLMYFRKEAPEFDFNNLTSGWIKDFFNITEDDLKSESRRKNKNGKKFTSRWSCNF